ncbi:MAG: HIT domain-containing protein [Microscillaceae bacterium]|jgi:histidine triad (HIT) family protein|nr:HIT domain-containing protein [Microscillaceae bacterium]
MKNSCLILFNILVISQLAIAQSPKYQQKKAEALQKPSPFEDIIAGRVERKLEYEDKYVVVFEAKNPQAPQHWLIVPKKRIATMNDLQKKDTKIVARMFEIALKIAQLKGIAQTGYRLNINTNEDAGQSVFHIHLHLLGGMKLGPMVDQSYRNQLKNEPKSKD